MKRAVLMMVASLGICLSAYSQGLTNNQKEKIASDIAAIFEKNAKAGENIDVKGLTEFVNDTLKAGFIENGIFINSFDELMKGQNEAFKGVKSLKYNVFNKRITVLADNAALLTASGNASLALEDGRTITGGFAWTFVYSKVNNYSFSHVNTQIEKEVNMEVQLLRKQRIFSACADL